jgi:hypothetical protein
VDYVHDGDCLQFVYKTGWILRYACVYCGKCDKI